MESMPAFKVKRSVPMPNGRGNTKTFDRYPWRDMKVGDMFFVPTPEDSHISLHQSNICAAARIVRRNPALKGWEFTTRQTEQGGKSGVGVWRTK